MQNIMPTPSVVSLILCFFRFSGVLRGTKLEHMDMFSLLVLNLSKCMQFMYKKT